MHIYYLMRSVSKKAGFTLVELIIVVAIISILAAIAIPQYAKFLIRSKRTEAVLILQGVNKVQTAYYSEFGRYWGGRVLAGRGLCL